MPGFREPAASVVQASSSTELSLSSSDHSGRSHNGSLRALFLFIFVWVLLHFSGASRRSRSLRVSAGLGVGLSRIGSGEKMLRTYFPHWSWKTHQTSPEQRWARSFSCCMVSFCHFKIRCGFFDHRSTHRNISDLRTVFPATELTVYPRGAVPLRINPNL